MTKSLAELIDDANAELPDPAEHMVIGAPDGEPTRFELYHANFSICSQKVRAVLTEKGVPFTSHHMNLPVSETRPSDSHRPGYVRLRLRGAPGAKMVSSYTGQSSASSEGFDPCVVPTLVDRLKERVVVDSMKICLYIENEVDTEPELIPSSIADAVHEQIRLTDEAPHPAVLYGAPPDGDDFRPEIVAIPIKNAHTYAINHLEKFKASVAGDSELVAAYDATLASRKSAKAFVYDRDSMIDAYARIANHVADLEKQLNTHSDDWVMGDAYTMADIMWSASLFRLKWLGLGSLWEEPGSAPRIAGYVERAFLRPGFRQAVIDWPMATPPSQHIPPSAPYADKLIPAWERMRAQMAN